MTEYAKFYIDGAWVEPDGTGRLEVIDSTTEEVFATVPAGTPADIGRAVAAAKAAFQPWSEQAPAERSKQLRRVAEGLESRKDEIADVEAHEIGMPRPQSASIQVGLGIRAFAAAADLLETFEFEDRSNGLVVKEPIGVVGAITPWNYPLNQIGAKVAYALAAGCTVVLKPSEVAPVNAFILAEIIDEIGFPAGVFNLVTGLGPVVGEALAAHPDVDMVSFTGSTRAGKRVSELAAQSVKRVAPGWPRSRRSRKPRRRVTPSAIPSPRGRDSDRLSPQPSSAGCAATSTKGSRKAPNSLREGLMHRTVSPPGTSCGRRSFQMSPAT
jgi:aldehyde dehydrogenase (NAD+)